MGLVVLKLLSLLKLGKAGGTIITMLLSLGIYAGIYGWRFAAGFIAMLFIHEMGHFLAARQRGLPVSTPTFIPFVGAWIELKEQPMDVETEAYVAAAGPFLGTVGAGLVYFWGRETGSGLLLAISYAGFFLNFFNLIPLSPLDGGRMTAILTPRIWFLGVPIMLAMLFYRPSPLLILIAIMALPALRQAWNYDKDSEENRVYYNASPAVKLEYGLFYSGLLAFLAVMTDATHEMIQGSLGN
ncbi:MAG: site-2 protease family protein [Sphingobium sp.]|nr:site-2 protease family protein [Sphingobium sp.]